MLIGEKERETVETVEMVVSAHGQALLADHMPTFKVTPFNGLAIK